MILLVVYPIIYTVYVSVTNYGTGNILSKEQVIAQLQERRIHDGDAGSYSYTAYRDDQGQLWFLFTGPQGSCSWATPASWSGCRKEMPA